VDRGFTSNRAARFLGISRREPQLHLAGNLPSESIVTNISRFVDLEAALDE
jgi:hypothetical protein